MPTEVLTGFFPSAHKPSRATSGSKSDFLDMYRYGQTASKKKKKKKKLNTAVLLSFCLF